MCRVGALLLLAWGFAATARATGDAHAHMSGDDDRLLGARREKYPVSMSIVVNFTDRTVQGFYLLELLDIPVKIMAANKVVAFGGQRKSPLH